jgi:hypothetical protein
MAVSDYKLIGNLTLRRILEEILEDAKLSLYSGHAIKLEGWRLGYGEVTNTCRFRAVLNDAGNCLLVLPSTLSRIEFEIKRKLGQADAQPAG